MGGAVYPLLHLRRAPAGFHQPKKKNHEMKHVFFWHVFISFFFFCFWLCVGVCGRVYAGWEMDAEHAAPAANVGKGGRIGSRTQRRVFSFGADARAEGIPFLFRCCFFLHARK